MLGKFRGYQLFSKLNKFNLWKRRINFLGYVVSEAGVDVDSEKMIVEEFH